MWNFKNVLDALKSFYNKTHNYIISYTRALVEKAKFNNTRISFIWVPLHCGIRGNKHVDLLTKRAIHDGVDENFKVPFSDPFFIPKLLI